jgi:hypothetical protein
VRYEGKQVETYSEKERTPSRILKPIKHSRNTTNVENNPRNYREKNKPLKTVLTKHAARKGQFHISKKGFRLQ